MCSARSALRSSSGKIRRMPISLRSRSPLGDGVDLIPDALFDVGGELVDQPVPLDHRGAEWDLPASRACVAPARASVTSANSWATRRSTGDPSNEASIRGTITTRHVELPPCSPSVHADVVWRSPWAGKVTRGGTFGKRIQSLVGWRVPLLLGQSENLKQGLAPVTISDLLNEAPRSGFHRGPSSSRAWASSPTPTTCSSSERCRPS